MMFKRCQLTVCERRLSSVSVIVCLLLQVRNLCYMVTKREKMRNRFHESKRDIFLQQAAILRSQSGRKLNARDVESVINAHHQSTSVYDNPDAVVRTARRAEMMAAAADGCETDWNSVSTSTAVDRVKRPKAGRPRIKGHRPTQPGSAPSAKASQPRRSLPSTENPYAKPTYRSFEWILSTRRRSSVGDDDASVIKRKRRRKLFGGSVSSPSPGEVSVVAAGDQTDSGLADFGGLLLDVTGSDATQSQEPSMNRSPASVSVRDRTLDDDKSRERFPMSASPTRDRGPMSVNESVTGIGDLISFAVAPGSSTPLKRSPLCSYGEPATSNHVLKTPQSSPNFNMSKLQARHFSDILVDRMSPSSGSRNRTVSQNSEDTYIDVVSDTPVPVSPVNNQPPVCNGFAEGLSRLSKAKAKKRLVSAGLVNGLRQRTLDGFVHRIPNGSQCPNGIDNAVEIRTENGNQDLKRSSSPSSVKLKQNSAGCVKENDEIADKSTLLVERTVDGSDNVVDMESIEGVWRRRTSLRSSTAFMSLLGPDLTELT